MDEPDPTVGVVVGLGDVACSAALSARTRETRKPRLVVTGPGLGVVAVRRPAVPRRVVPATAANHAVRASGGPAGSSVGDFA